MSSIFNSFLFLFSVWIVLMLISGNVSLYYFICGLISSSLIGYFSYKIRLNNKSPLHLNFAFYRHFTMIFLRNFLNSIKLIWFLALNKEPIKPKVYKASFSEKMKFDLGLLSATINMTSGLLFINFNKEEISIHVLDKKYFDEKSLKYLILELTKLNTSNI